MFSILVIAGLGYLGYRVSKRAPRARRGLFSFQTYVPQSEAVTPATRAVVHGEQGEAAVRSELRRVLSALCGENFHLHDSAVLIHHAPGTAFPTAEIDHIAVTPFGIFVIETKNWSGVIAPGAVRDEVSRTGIDGVTDARRSPLAQNRTKIEFLNARLPALWPIEGLGVFASPECTVDPRLPLPLIHISELAVWMRLRLHEFTASGRKPVNVRGAWEAIMLIASINAEELEEHRKRVRAHPKDRANDAV